MMKTDSCVTGDTDVEQRHSVPPAPSLSPPSLRDLNVVPDVDQLRFFRLFPARGRPAIRQITPPESFDHHVWPLSSHDEELEDDVGQTAGLLPRPVVPRRTWHPVDASKHRSSSRRLTMVVLAVLVALLLLLSLVAVWIWRRRRLLRTAPKL